ncbi:MAG: NAD(P)/FAD-dependent oxidoreductase [Chloroflexi bacterium]|nr:NAD(P)/FAD-dependent oxidoreductase [Chloroflexota bacterium]
MPIIAIVGAGFGGLRAARALSHAPARVILIDRNNYHLFQPLLYQVATAGLSPDEIAHPVRAILRNQHNLEFRLAEVTRVDLAARQLTLSTGSLDYDYLILAVGGATNYFGLDSVSKTALALKDVDDAVAIRNHLLRMFELAAQEPDPDTRRALLTFVVVGGGPTGVESAGAISELIRLVLTKDYRSLNFKEARVILLEATDKLLAAYPEPLREAAAETLWSKKIEVRFMAAVTDFDGSRVALKGGEVIPSRTLIWAAGIKAAPLVDTLGVKQARLGRVIVSPSLQLPDHPEAFVIGDAAYLESGGQPLPLVAPVAIQQAETAAENIKRLIVGQPLIEFVYKDPGSLATIGRNAAVAQFGKLQFHGFIAWVMWLAVHIYQIIGFRNRLVVLINWAWDYLFYDRAVRLISSE